tara:strand:+ start:381 stop:689 length:309 start_codon:yes stop_codon:yes gene_type:complete
MTEDKLQVDLMVKGNLITDIEKRKIPKEDWVAYVGMVCIQFALAPSHLSTDLPHYSLPLMVFIGLICYQYRAFIQRDRVYTIGNAVGLIMNGSMLIRIWVNF